MKAEIRKLEVVQDSTVAITAMQTAQKAQVQLAQHTHQQHVQMADFSYHAQQQEATMEMTVRSAETAKERMLAKIQQDAEERENHVRTSQSRGIRLQDRFGLARFPDSQPRTALMPTL